MLKFINEKGEVVMKEDDNGKLHVLHEDYKDETLSVQQTTDTDVKDESHDKEKEDTE